MARAIRYTRGDDKPLDKGHDEHLKHMIAHINNMIEGSRA